MKTIIKEHGLAWWKNNGAKCPDCGLIAITIISQRISSLVKCNGFIDDEFIADFKCLHQDCGCIFTNVYVEKDARKKREKWEK